LRSAKLRPIHASSSNTFAEQPRKEHERQGNGPRFHGGSMKRIEGCDEQISVND